MTVRDLRALAISELRQNLPMVIDEVAKRGETVIVTRRSTPVAKVVPYTAEDEQVDAFPLRGVPVELSADFDKPLKDLSEGKSK